MQTCEHEIDVSVKLTVEPRILLNGNIAIDIYIGEAFNRSLHSTVSLQELVMNSSRGWASIDDLSEFKEAMEDTISLIDKLSSEA